jgi:DNA-binding HxlR family transcriptional regulator
MLSARLKELEARGVVERRVEAGPPVRVAYLLTKAGGGFKDVAEAVSRWGEQLEQGRVKARPAGAKPVTPEGRKKRAEARAQR